MRLTDGQHRFLVSTLLVVERSINRLRQLVSHLTTSGRLSPIEDTLTEREKQEIVNHLDEIEKTIADLQTFFNLKGDLRNVRRVIYGELVTLWTLMEESKSKRRLKGYGDVPPEVARHLDTAMEHMISLIQDIERVLGLRTEIIRSR